MAYAKEMAIIVLQIILQPIQVQKNIIIKTKLLINFSRTHIKNPIVKFLKFIDFTGR
jgi:hypothetical protein